MSTTVHSMGLDALIGRAMSPSNWCGDGDSYDDPGGYRATSRRMARRRRFSARCAWSQQHRIRRSRSCRTRPGRPPHRNCHCNVPASQRVRLRGSQNVIRPSSARHPGMDGPAVRQRNLIRWATIAGCGA